MEKLIVKKEGDDKMGAIFVILAKTAGWVAITAALVMVANG